MNTLALTGDLYGLSGAILGVFGRTWLSRQLKRRVNLPVPAGSTSTKIDLRLSADYFNTLSFFLIGAGFGYLLANDLGLQSSNPYTFAEAILLMLAMLGLGFTSYVTRGTSGREPYQEKWTVVHGRNAAIVLSMLIMFLGATPLLTVGIEGTDNWLQAMIQLIIAAITVVYFFRKLEFANEDANRE